MRPLIAALAIVFLFGLAVNPLQQGDTHNEIAIKQTIMQNDAELTQKLCVQHCLLRMENTVTALNGDDNRNAKAKAELEQLVKDHPHIRWAAWSENHGETRTIEVGTPSDHAKKLKNQVVSAGLRDPRAQASSGIYNVDGHPHTFLMKRSNNLSSVLMAEVKMQLVTEVKQQQKRNLGLTRFPSKGKPGIKTVDSESWNKKNVDHPEENEGTSHYRVKEVVVKFKQDPSPEHISTIEQRIDGRLLKETGPFHVFKSNSIETKQMIKLLENEPTVQYAEPHFIYITNQIDGDWGVIPNDLLYEDYQYNLPAIETEKGWDLSRGKEEVIIAVVDTGVDLDHPEFKGKLVDGMNFIDPESKPYDDVGHGTHVAGIIGALTNNEEGIAGVTWFNKIMPIKVLDSTGTGSTYDVAQGIIWAVDHGAKVINLSLGNYAEAQFLHDAVKYANDRDVLLVAATGNDNTEQPGYPAAYPEVIAVGATDERTDLAPFSNYGQYVDVTAPGVNIPSTYPENQYAALSGTSMASPHVAALAGLIRSIDPDLSNDEVAEMIRQTSIDLGRAGHDPYYGEGQINVAMALQATVPEEKGPVETPKTGTNGDETPFFQRITEQLRSFLQRLF